MNPPAITVLLPVADPAPWLDEAADSILRQTEPDFELIVVDDHMAPPLSGSGRGWLQDPRVRVVRREAAQRGIVATLQRGLDEARGEFVARMDADDVALPHRLERQARYLREQPELGLVSCGVRPLGRAGVGYAAHMEWCNSIVTPEQFRSQRFVESPCPHPSVMFRRRLIGTLGGYRDGPFPEDYELWLRWLEAGVQMAKVPETLLLWRDSPSRLSRADPRYSIDAFYGCKAPYLARWLAANNPHHPDVWVWGAGRVTRRRLSPLLREGVRVAGYVDIDPRKVGRRLHGAEVMSPDALPAPGGGFVLSCVMARGARALIQSALERRGYRAGRDYLPVA